VASEWRWLAHEGVPLEAEGGVKGEGRCALALSVDGRHYGAMGGRHKADHDGWGCAGVQLSNLSGVQRAALPLPLPHPAFQTTFSPRAGRREGPYHL
jgi:hypothetical protein